MKINKFVLAIIFFVASAASATTYTLLSSSTTSTSSFGSYTGVNTAYYVFEIRVSSIVSSPTLQVGIQEQGAISNDPVSISSYTSLTSVTNITAAGLYSFYSDIVVGGNIRANYSISGGTATITVRAREVNP